jgi:hypothetical protein
MPDIQQPAPNCAITGVAPSCAWDWNGNTFNWTGVDELQRGIIARKSE